jgi:hypothetical protein
MAKKRAGWERMLYYGAAGSTAATAVSVNVTDIDIRTANEYVETTDRGAGTNLPQKTEQQVCVGCEISFKMRYKDGDANVAAFLAASRSVTTPLPKAIKVVRYSGGATEFDGDCYLEDDSPGPLKDGMEITFTCHPTDDSGRAWTMA